MTGMKYITMQYGSVPENWGTVYNSLEGIEMNESILPNQSSGIKLDRGMDSVGSPSTLSESEQQILGDVYERFKYMNARDISLESHKEKGWIENLASRSIINYEYAFELSIQ